MQDAVVPRREDKFFPGMVLAYGPSSFCNMFAFIDVARESNS